MSRKTGKKKNKKKRVRNKKSKISLSQRTFIDPVHGRIEASPLEYEIIRTKEFQRLRGICQISFGQVELYGANHTRYEHSLGVMHLAGLMWDALASKIALDNSYRAVLRIAALLHDVGHSAFSHSVEQVIQRNPQWVRRKKISHEKFGASVILGNSSLNRILSSKPSYNVDLVAAIIGEDTRKITPRYRFLLDIIAGDFGCDRIDYLLRDSHHAGLSYGKIEINRLINRLNLRTIRRSRRLCIEYDRAREGIHAATFLLLARYHHFANIVHRPKIRAANSLFAKALEEYLKDNEVPFEEIQRCFLEYDDSMLWSKVRSNRLAFRYIRRIERNQIPFARTRNAYMALDDLIPAYAFHLHILKEEGELRDLEDYIQIDIINEEMVEGKNPIIFVDIDLATIGAIPSEFYLTKVGKRRSLLAFDKAPILLTLSQNLATLGSTAIYSYKPIYSKFNFHDYFYEFTCPRIKEIRKEKAIRQELLLLTIEKCSAEMERIQRRTPTDLLTDVRRSVPAISRLMKIIKELNIGYRDFVTVRFNFHYSPSVMRDLLTLIGLRLVGISLRPTIIEMTGEPHTNLSKPEYVLKTDSIVQRFEFWTTWAGRKYVEEIEIDEEKHGDYEINPSRIVRSTIRIRV